MEIDPTYLACVGVLAALVIAIMLKNKAEQVRDAAYLQKAIQLGGRYKRRIGNNGGIAPRWIKSGEHVYHLCAEDALLASLNLTTNGQLASGQSTEGIWDARYGAWWNSTCVIYQANSGRREATLQASFWTGNRIVTFANGGQFSFRDGHCYSAAHERLITFGVQGRTVRLEAGAHTLPCIALLVLLGSALMLQALDYGDD